MSNKCINLDQTSADTDTVLRKDMHCWYTVLHLLEIVSLLTVCSCVFLCVCVCVSVCVCA